MELHDVITSLLDRDGSSRDMNFEAPSLAGVERLLTLLEAEYGCVSGSDQEGDAFTRPYRERALATAQNGGHAHLLFSEGAGLIKNLQAFISAEEDGLPFVELTFFPDDVRPTSSLRGDFIAWAQKLQFQLEARRYYARYENASWRFGDVGTQSGVFLVSDEVA